MELGLLITILSTRPGSQTRTGPCPYEKPPWTSAGGAEAGACLRASELCLVFHERCPPEPRGCEDPARAASHTAAELRSPEFCMPVAARRFAAGMAAALQVNPGSLLSMDELAEAACSPVFLLLVFWQQICWQYVVWHRKMIKLRSCILDGFELCCHLTPCTWLAKEASVEQPTHVTGLRSAGPLHLSLSIRSMQPASAGRSASHHRVRGSVGPAGRGSCVPGLSNTPAPRPSLRG